VGDDGLLHPVGSMYRPSESGYLYVVDRLTQYLYKLRQSDRKIVAKWYLGASLTNQPIGLSGDPTDSAHFYVLDAHLPGSGTYTNCKVRKFDVATKALVSTTTLPDGQWSDMKFDGSHLWLTNFGDDKLYVKTFVAGGAAGATASYSYAGKTNPTGLYLDGTTIGCSSTAARPSTSSTRRRPGRSPGRSRRRARGSSAARRHDDARRPVRHERGRRLRRDGRSRLEVPADRGDHDGRRSPSPSTPTSRTRSASSRHRRPDHDEHPGDDPHPFEIRLTSPRWVSLSSRWTTSSATSTRWLGSIPCGCSTATGPSWTPTRTPPA
jgi:hypothetical protein